MVILLLKKENQENTDFYRTYRHQLAEFTNNLKRIDAYNASSKSNSNKELYLAKTTEGKIVEGVKNEITGALTGDGDKEKPGEEHKTGGPEGPEGPEGPGETDGKGGPGAPEGSEKTQKPDKNDISKAAKKAKDNAKNLNPSDYSGKSISDSFGSSSTEMGTSFGSNISSSGNSENDAKPMEILDGALEFGIATGSAVTYGIFIFIAIICTINVIIFITNDNMNNMYVSEFIILISFRQLFLLSIIKFKYSPRTIAINIKHIISFINLNLEKIICIINCEIQTIMFKTKFVKNKLDIL